MKVVRKMSEKYLIYKTVILMTLTSASSASALHCLDVRFMVKSETAKNYQNYFFISTQKIKNCVWCLA